MPERFRYDDRLANGAVAAIIRAAPLVGIVLITIGGIYSGDFTPVEATGAGAVLTSIFALFRRKLSSR